MVDRIQRYGITITAGTTTAAPATTTMTFNDGIVRRVDVRVPPGPSGFMGFQIAYAGVPVIPDNADEYMVMDGEGWSYDLDNNPTGGQWQLVGYNTDIYDHVVYVTFHVDEIPKPVQAAQAILPIPLGG